MPQTVAVQKLQVESYKFLNREWQKTMMVTHDKIYASSLLCRRYNKLKS